MGFVPRANGSLAGAGSFSELVFVGRHDLKMVPSLRSFLKPAVHDRADGKPCDKNEREHKSKKSGLFPSGIFIFEVEDFSLAGFYRNPEPLKFRIPVDRFHRFDSFSVFDFKKRTLLHIAARI